jgi:hypothetical protein
VRLVGSANHGTCGIVLRHGKMVRKHCSSGRHSPRFLLFVFGIFLLRIFQTIQANDPRLRQASSSFCTDLDEDLEACTNHNDNDNLSSPTCLPAREEDNTASACCLICLETWQAGDLLCQSTGCPHAFHQGCIVAWLLVRRSNTRSDCPCCRQDFCSVQTTRGRAAAVTGAPPVVPTTTATLTTTATSPHTAVRAPPAEDPVES